MKILKSLLECNQECNLKFNLSKIPVVFYSLQNYDSYLIFQEIGQFNFKINVIPKATKNIWSCFLIVRNNLFLWASSFSLALL